MVFLWHASCNIRLCDGLEWLVLFKLSHLHSHIIVSVQRQDAIILVTLDTLLTFQLCKALKNGSLDPGK